MIAVFLVLTAFVAFSAVFHIFLRRFYGVPHLIWPVTEYVWSATSLIAIALALVQLNDRYEDIRTQTAPNMLSQQVETIQRLSRNLLESAADDISLVNIFGSKHEPRLIRRVLNGAQSDLNKNVQQALQLPIFLNPICAPLLGDNWPTHVFNMGDRFFGDNLGPIAFAESNIYTICLNSIFAKNNATRIINRQPDIIINSYFAWLLAIWPFVFIFGLYLKLTKVNHEFTTAKAIAREQKKL